MHCQTSSNVGFLAMPTRQSILIYGATRECFHAPSVDGMVPVNAFVRAIVGQSRLPAAKKWVRLTYSLSIPKVAYRRGYRPNQ
jgi:hypothetical protein